MGAVQDTSTYERNLDNENENENENSVNVKNIAHRESSAMPVAMGAWPLMSATVDAAQAFVQANRVAASPKLGFLHAERTVVCRSDGIWIRRPDAASPVVADGRGNGPVSNAGNDPACVIDVIAIVSQPGGNAADVGPEDAIDVVVSGFLPTDSARRFCAQHARRPRLNQRRLPVGLLRIRARRV